MTTQKIFFVKNFFNYFYWITWVQKPLNTNFHKNIHLYHESHDNLVLARRFFEAIFKKMHKNCYKQIPFESK